MAICKHPGKSRQEGPDAEHLRCTACGRVFRPRGAPVRHGTYLGYCKHHRDQCGEWDWPACKLCVKAASAWRDEYSHRERSIVNRHVRSAARAAALARLSHVFPGIYAAVYAEEMERRSPGTVVKSREFPMWDDVISHLVRDATGRDEWDMSRRARRGLATDRETRIMRHAARLRLLTSQLAREAGYGASGD